MEQQPAPAHIAERDKDSDAQPRAPPDLGFLNVNSETLVKAMEWTPPPLNGITRLSGDQVCRHVDIRPYNVGEAAGRPFRHPD